MRSWKTAVGSINSWSPWVIVSTLLLRLITALTSDPNRTGNFSPLWLLIWLISCVALSAWVLLAMGLGLYRRLKTKPRPFANLLVIGIAGVIGNLTVGWLALGWGLDTEPLWTVRVLGGFVGSIFMFFVINTLRANLVSRNESIRQLEQTERELLGYRESAKQIIADEIEGLKQKTVATLLPAIEKIQELLTVKSDERSSIVQELRQLIKNDVRPLSKSVLEDAATLAKPGHNEVKRPTTRLRRKVKYNFQISIRPLISLFFFASIFPMIEFVVIDHRSALRGLLGGIATGIMYFLVKALTPKNFEVKATTGVTLQVFISAICIVPAWWIMHQEYGNTPEVLSATAIIWLITFLGSFLLAFTKGVEINSERYEISLSQFTAELKKEVALFEQKLALEKRAWSRIIHGEVQSALTAAVTRLQRSNHLEPYELEMIKQDLNRAKQNLINPPTENTNFTQAFSEIVLTWKSICNITADISARAQRAVDANQDTRNVTNEIIKEAVSNAVRHGQAKNVSIKLDRIQDDILEIEITNDGYRPSPNQKPGLGSQMLDELSLSWSLNTIKNQTTLKAVVPIPKSK